MKKTARKGGASLRRACGIVIKTGLGFSALTVVAQAQLVPHIINQNELGQSVAVPNIGHQQIPKSSVPRVSAPKIAPFRLLTVEAQGGAMLPIPALVATWKPYLGTVVSDQQVSDIMVAIGKLCQKQNLALYAISLPGQDFAGGRLVIRVVIGHVAAVSIAGNSGRSNLWLLKAYAAHIIEDQPLHHATLERNILLMQAIPGLTVGSQLRPIQGQPGAEQLQLGIIRKPVQAGFNINNQGDPQLDIVQATANVTVNGLFREGERDQLVFGAPLTLRRYQYYGLLHQEPIGSDGDTLTFNGGDLVTNPVEEPNSGTAQIASLIFSAPLVSTVTRNLTVSVEADYLNNNEALLGQTVSSEKTRTLRASMRFARAGDWNGVESGALTIAQGIDFLGAERGSVVYGGPDFTKVNVNFVRLQALPKAFVFTFSGSGQYTPDHLPASEQFLYGGQQFGQAYDAATLAGDRGIALSGELSHPVRGLEKIPGFLLSGLTAFGFADWGHIWNIDTPYQYASDAGASAGAGLRLTVLQKITVSVAAASQLNKPEEEDKLQPWRCVFNVSGQF